MLLGSWLMMLSTSLVGVAARAFARAAVTETWSWTESPPYCVAMSRTPVTSNSPCGVAMTSLMVTSQVSINDPHASTRFLPVTWPRKVMAVCRCGSAPPDAKV